MAILKFLIIFKKEALHFHFTLGSRDARWWSWRLGEDGGCDLGQRSRPKALGREAGVSHRLCLIPAGTMLGSAGLHRCLHLFSSIAGVHGRQPPFQWPSLTSIPETSLGMERGTSVEGKALPQLWERNGGWWAHPSTEVSLTSCSSPVVVYLLTL